MTLDFMSSEESADNSDSENEKFIVKPIPWRSEKVTDMFKNKINLILLSPAARVNVCVSLELRGLQHSGELLFHDTKIVCGPYTVQCIPLLSRLSSTVDMTFSLLLNFSHYHLCIHCFNQSKQVVMSHADA